MDVPDENERPALSEAEIAARIGELEVGDRFLFDDRQEPLQVRTTDAEGSVAFGEALTGIEAKARSSRYVFDPDKAMYLRRGGVVRRSIDWIQRV